MKKTRSRARAPEAFIVAVLGPAGSGKSTLIRELAARFRSTRPAGRMAIFANAPTHAPTAAVASAGGSPTEAADNHPFFARSLPSGAGHTEISAEIPTTIEAFDCRGEHDLVFVEFATDATDAGSSAGFNSVLEAAAAVVCVLTPELEGPISLNHAALLNAADLIVLNKCDDSRTAAVKAALMESLEAKGGDRQLYPTIATKGEDLGVEALFEEIAELAGWNTGGEKPCQLRIEG